MDEDMDIEEIAEENVNVDASVKDVIDNNESLVTGNHGCIGCGELLGLKIALQTLGKCIVVHSGGEMALLGKYPNSYVHVPFVSAGNDAATLASSISKNTEAHVVAYSGDGATRENFSSLIRAAESGRNFTFICYNNQSYSLFTESLALMLSQKISFAATASVSHPGDFIKKLCKASGMPGTKYIEVLTPCPRKWGFDSSLTMDVARIAVESKAWPLYEVVNGKIEMSSLPTSVALTSYFSSQERFSGVDENVLQKIENQVNRIWKSLR